MVISSNSMAWSTLGNYQSYTQSGELTGQKNKESFGSVAVKASSTVMNVVLTDLQGTVSKAVGSKANLDIRL